MKPLTEKQAAFVQEYIVDFNGTQAVIRAGYSPKGAHVRAAELLRNRKVQAALQEAIKARAERTKVDADYVVTRLRDNVERAMQAEPVYDREGNPTGEYTYQGSVANGALNLLGKHLRMFVDRHEHTGKDGAPLFTLEDFMEVKRRAERGE